MNRTRLAPSPTGRLHLGNARTFLINWLLARQEGARVVLRIEDLDAARCRPELLRTALDDLRWLGLTHDEGPFLQSERLPTFARAADELRAGGLVYPCVCTRREVRAASAPHAEDEEITYPGTCRGRFATEEEARDHAGRTPALRFRVPPGEVEFEDRVLGATRIDPSIRGGDFVIRSPDGMWSYQLAVAVDDAAMGVTDVVRGDDLVPSTPRQILILRALGNAAPRYAHVPLVLDADGRRLAKRHGDTELAALRDAGISAERVLATVAGLCGIDAGRETSAAELVPRFDLARLPRGPVRIGDLGWSGEVPRS